MLFLSIIVFSTLSFVVFLKLVAYAIGEKAALSREELTPYECGFEHHSLSRVPFSLRYFFLTLIFLLFDLEIVLLLFTPQLVFTSNSLVTLCLIVFFLLILLSSLIYEWNDGTLEWLS